MMSVHKMIRLFFLLILLSFSVNIYADSSIPTTTTNPTYYDINGNLQVNNPVNQNLYPPAADQAAAAAASNTINNGVLDDSTFSDNMSQAMAKVIAAINSTAATFSQNIASMAVTLLTWLSIIAITWSGMNLAMTSGSLSEPMNKLIITIFTIGFATWLIGDGYDTFVTKGIDNLMDVLVSKTPGGTTLDQMFNAFMISEFQVIGKVIDTLKAMTMWQLVTKGGLTILFVIVLFVGMLITSLMGMIAVITALIMVAIAVALGPIFIPFIVLQKTSFLFDGWLKFLINACLTKVIIALLLAIGFAAMEATVLGMGTSTSNGALIGSLMAGLVISGVIGTLMLTAPGIAGAVTSGGAMSQDGFAGRMHSSAGKMLRNASVKSSQAAGGALNKMGNKDGSGALNKLGDSLRSSSSSGNINGLKSSSSGSPPSGSPPSQGKG